MTAATLEAPAGPPPTIPVTTTDEPQRCTHCNRSIMGNQWGYTHASGRYRRLQSCDPQDSGLPYGYNAHPTGTPCVNPCIGASR